MKSQNLVAGFLAGVAAGAVLGVLFAPDRGSETRKAISKKSGDLMHGINDQLARFKGSIGDKYRSVKEDVVNKYEEVKDDSAELLHEGKEKIASMKGTAKQHFS